MKHLSTTKLALTFFMTGLSQHVVAQSSPELEITMQVMEAGQHPAGLIQRIELPPPDFFLQEEVAISTAEVLQDTVLVESNDLQETVSEIVADQVRDTISIDGTVTTDPDISLPEQIVNELPNDIVDILDDDLPLQNTLEETLTELNDQTPDLVDGILSTAPVSADIDNTLVQDIDTSLMQDVETNLNGTTTDIVDVFNDTNSDLLSDDIQSLGSDVNDSVNTILETVDEEVIQSTQDVTDETSDTVQEIIDGALPIN